MEAVLGFLKGRAGVVYLDGVLIVGAILEEHLRKLDQVLTVLFKAGFRLNMEKCQFGLTTIFYLGYVINVDDVSPMPEKVKAI